MMKNRRGFVLPTVIFAITIMSVVVIVALTTAADERRASRATREATLAMYAADAGLRATYGAWPTATVKTMAPGDSADLGWKTLPNAAAYRAVIHRVDNGGLKQYTVVVQGRRTDPFAGVITVVGGVGETPNFKYAVATSGNISLTSVSTLDAWDSDKGTYAATVQSAGNVRANGDVSVTLSTVKGDATAAGNVNFGFFGFVTGTTTSSAPAMPAMDVPACPGSFTPSANVPTGAGISYSAVTGVLTVSGAVTLTLTDTAYYFSSIVLSSGGKISFPGAPRAVVMLRDSLNAGGGTVANVSGIPTNLSFSSCGTSATPAKWILSSGATPGYYSVYAPNHVVSETGSDDFYGAVVGASYTSSGGGKFHFDQALTRMPSGRLSVEKGAWAQLPGS